VWEVQYIPFVEHTSTFESPFDENGVLYWIGTDGGSRPYTNPHDSGDVVASMSTIGEGKLNRVVLHKHTGGEKNYTNGGDNEWMGVDLGDGCLLVPNHYCLRHGFSSASYAMRHWRLEGSNDGEQWVSLKEHTDDKTLAEGYQAAGWALEGVDQGYRHFRVVQTGENSDSNTQMMCAGMAFYGTLRARAASEDGEDGRAGELESGVVARRIKRRLMAEWSHGSYYNGVVKEEMESGEFVVLADVDKNGDGTMTNCDVVDYLKKKGEVRVGVSVFEDLKAAAANASTAAVAAAAAMAYVTRTCGFLATAQWWPKAGDRVSMGSGDKEQVWRDIAAADVASIEVGMRLKVDRKGDGKSIEEAMVVKAGAEAGTLVGRDGKGEGGETEGGVAIGRLKQRLVHEWAHRSYSNGTVKRDKGDGTFFVAFDGLVRVSDIGIDSWPVVGDWVTVMKEGEEEGTEGEIGRVNGDEIGMDYLIVGILEEFTPEVLCVKGSLNVLRRYSSSILLYVRRSYRYDTREQAQGIRWRRDRKVTCGRCRKSC
jgi:hypothetical protein